MTLFVFIAIFVIAIIVFVVTDRNKGFYEDRQKDLANKMYGVKNQEANQVLSDLKTEAQRIQAFIQANLVGDTLTADAISSGTYTGPLPERLGDGGWLSIYDNLRILKIAGINHRPDICRYVGRVECALVPEPDNEYDPDAIKIVASDRHLLGYIPAGYSDMVCSWTANEYPYRCTAFIQEHEDETDGHQFFTGQVYIRRLD